MKKYNKYIKKGFTLVELLIAVALITVVIIVSMNMFFFGTNAHKLTFKEYEIQSDVRIATEQVTNIVRYSKAVFGVPYPFVESTSKMDPGWSYFMVSADGKRIVSMDYNDTTKVHEEKIIVEEQDNIEYKMTFEKDKNAKNDNVMIYKIYAQVVDENGNKVRDKIVFESTVESVNAIQVADKGTDAAPSIALAYRNDGQTSGKGKNEIAYITIITDVSGSMAANPAGEYVRDKWGDIVYDENGLYKEHDNARIRFVREALAGDGKKEGIIQFFSKEENIYLSLIPFSTTANTPNPMDNSEPNRTHDIYDVFNVEHSSDMKRMANSLVAYGGTNTGDALRQAYHLHNDFRDRMKATIKPEDQVHHYMILLVDGETTYQTNNHIIKDVGKYEKETYSRNGNRYDYYKYVPKVEFEVILNEFTSKGNVSASRFNYPETIVRGEPKKNYYYSRNKPYGLIIPEKTPIFQNITELGLYGDGRTIIKNASSIKTMGNLIKSFDDGNGIGSYLIGYASGLEGEIGYIADSIGTPENIVNPQDSTQNKTYRYLYNNKDFDVSDILKQIANDIMADFWLATGPQIQ